MSLLKKGGKLVIIFAILAAVLAFLQNVLAVGLGTVMGVNPLIALMTGSTPMTGGHGTAAAVGNALEELGVSNMTDLAYTCATIGIVGGILFGMGIINWGSRKGYTHYVEDPADLPVELRTGLIPTEKQKSAGKVTVSSISVDPLAFHLGIVLVAALGGYYMTKWFKVFSGNLGYAVAIPEFCTALLAAFVLNWLLNKTGASDYIDRNTISRIQGASTDLLMVSGIGSLNLKVVFDYAVPLLVVCSLGFIITYWWFIYVGGKSSRTDWFERNMNEYKDLPVQTGQGRNDRPFSKTDAALSGRKIKHIFAVYFSPTGNTARIVTHIANILCAKLGTTIDVIDYTLPHNREAGLNFTKDDLVIWGTPVYAGRTPNKLLYYIRCAKGNGALAVPVAVFGNRNYDDCLLELQKELEKNSFHTIAGAAFVSAHG